MMAGGAMIIMVVVIAAPPHRPPHRPPELEFPSAFRQSHRNGRPCGIIKLRFGGTMIRNEAEYHEASKRLGDELKGLDEHRARLKEAGLGDVEVNRVIDPLESFHLQLKEEVEAYEL